MTPKIISVCNLKGGAGKSTIAVNIACAIQRELGKEAVVVDADKQATASIWAKPGKLGIRVVAKILQEAKPEDRYPGMLWITQIKGMAEKDQCIIIDLPPGLQFSLAAVTAVSDLVLIPVNPSGIDFHSTSSFVDLIQKSPRSASKHQAGMPDRSQ